MGMGVLMVLVEDEPSEKWKKLHIGSRWGKKGWLGGAPMPGWPCGQPSLGGLLSILHFPARGDVLQDCKEGGSLCQSEVPGGYGSLLDAMFPLCLSKVCEGYWNLVE